MLTHLITPPLDDCAPESMEFIKTDAREKIRAAAVTVCKLMEMGEQYSVEPEDKAIARKIFEDGRVPTPAEMQTPGIVLHLEALLEDYDRFVVADATRLRRYVTGRLLEESGPEKDPKQALRALEMLGKITEVQLFTERTEVTIKQQTTSELEDQLKNALSMINAKTVEGEVVQRS